MWFLLAAHAIANEPIPAPESYGVWLPELEAVRHAWEEGPHEELSVLCAGEAVAWYPMWGQGDDAAAEAVQTELTARLSQKTDCTHALVVYLNRGDQQIDWAEVVSTSRLSPDRGPVVVRHVVIRRNPSLPRLAPEVLVDALLEGLKETLPDQPLTPHENAPPHRKRPIDQVVEARLGPAPEPSGSCDEARELLGTVSGCDEAYRMLGGEWVVRDGAVVRGFSPRGLLSFERPVGGEFLGSCGMGFVERQGNDYTFSNAAGVVWHRRTTARDVGCRLQTIIEVRGKNLIVDEITTGISRQAGTRLVFSESPRRKVLVGERVVVTPAPMVGDRAVRW